MILCKSRLRKTTKRRLFISKASWTLSQRQNKLTILDIADKALVIDCTGMEYISSAGLRFFMQLKRESEAKGGSVRIEHLNEDVADIFRMSGFLNIFEIE